MASGTQSNLLPPSMTAPTARTAAAPKRTASPNSWRITHILLNAADIGLRTPTSSIGHRTDKWLVPQLKRWIAALGNGSGPSLRHRNRARTATTKGYGTVADSPKAGSAAPPVGGRGCCFRLLKPATERDRRGFPGGGVSRQRRRLSSPLLARHATATCRPQRDRRTWKA